MLPAQTVEYFFGLYIVVFVISAAFGIAYRNRIRTHHPDTWVELGSPTFFSNNSILNSLRSTTFLLRKKYEKLGDDTLNFYGRWARLGFFSILAFIAAFLPISYFSQSEPSSAKSYTPHQANHPINPVGAAILILIVMAIAATSLLTKYIQNNHRDLWKELGQPSFLNNTLSNGPKLTGFIWSARHYEFRDNRLSAYIFGVRGLTVALGVLFFLVVTGNLHT